MAKNSKIERTDHTANLWWGCTQVHAGCDNCYPLNMANRWKNNIWGDDNPKRMIKSFWNDISKYQKAAASGEEIHKIFVGSMIDIFEKTTPLVGHRCIPLQ